MSSNYHQWVERFQAELLRRTGIDANEEEMTEEMLAYQIAGFSPVDAVLHQIMKYGLLDFTEEMGWKI